VGGGREWGFVRREGDFRALRGVPLKKEEESYKGGRKEGEAIPIRLMAGGGLGGAAPL